MTNYSQEKKQILRQLTVTPHKKPYYTIRTCKKNILGLLLIFIVGTEIASFSSWNGGRHPPKKVRDNPWWTNTYNN